MTSSTVPSSPARHLGLVLQLASALAVPSTWNMLPHISAELTPCPHSYLCSHLPCPAQSSSLHPSLLPSPIPLLPCGSLTLYWSALHHPSPTPGCKQHEGEGLQGFPTSFPAPRTAPAMHNPLHHHQESESHFYSSHPMLMHSNEVAMCSYKWACKMLGIVFIPSMRKFLGGYRQVWVNLISAYLWTGRSECQLRRSERWASGSPRLG